MHNKKVGEFGEELAISFLKKRGYIIIDKNVKLSYKELDVVAKIKQKIVFIEVKTRTNNTLGTAENAMSAKKLHHLKKAVSMYVNNQKNIDQNNIRLDLICIDINKDDKIANIKHFKDIF